jgi:hypothetical protein
MNARTLLVAVTLLLTSPAWAQDVNLARIDEQAPNHVHVRTGAEHGFVAGVGYARAVPFLGRTILLGADATLPWGGFDAGDYALRATALVPIVGGEHWRLAGSLSPAVRATSNDASRMTSLGMDLGAVGGYYARGWFAGGELGFDWAMTTYVAHSDLYRRIVYAGARDGWYGNPGGNLRLGVQAGVSFSRFDLVLRAGKLRDLKGEGPMFPLYATLALDTRW